MERFMRKLAFLLLTFLVTVRVASAQGPEDKARFAAEQWVVLVDDGQYDESWKEASKVFQDLNPAPDWQKKTEADRAQLGPKQSRKLKDVKSLNSVRGLPSGQYVMVKYQSSYANKKTATETITAVLDGDGNWRIAAYALN
jgi:Protein of unknown function (DUF4019)